MNKNAIKKFAIAARNKLIASVTDKAGMLGITSDFCSEPVSKGTGFEVYQTTAGTEVTLGEKKIEQRRKLAEQIRIRGFEAVVEEVAYTWFNRICAIRFMEVNDYMYPVRVRVLSSEKEGKKEPDILTLAPDIEWDFTDKERDYIIDAKAGNRLDDLFRMLFIKQCNLLHEVLPGLFEETEDYTEMLLNISFTNKDDVIRMIVDGVDEKDFNVSALGEDGKPTGQVEIIGWLYQYYNTELKDDTSAKSKKNIKVSKERIPAATQLFTPEWIVRYMVENSVGRIWIEHLRANDPAVDEKKTAEKFGWKYYLPEAEQEESVNAKLAEIRTTYRDMKPEDITCIDPCMGSGHILIAMFDVMMDIYESTGYDKREAAYKIVENNIHGLDIDKRAYQLAYFAVMMKVRGYNRRFLREQNNKKIVPKVYAVTESGCTDKNGNKKYNFDKEVLEYFINGDSGMESDITHIVNAMFDAREYGSVLRKTSVNYEKIFYRFREIEEEISLYKKVVMDKLYPIVYIAYMLGERYDVVITNPPYMGASKMGNELLKYVKDNYPDSKRDLFAVFIEKCNEMTKVNAYQAMITQHAWMFLVSFEKLRKKMMQNDIVNMAHLGVGAFEEIDGEVVQTTSFVMRKGKVKGYQGTYCRLIEAISQNDKEEMFLAEKNRYVMAQNTFTKIPGSPVAYWVSKNTLEIYNTGKLMGEIVLPCAGLATGDNTIFQRIWHEVSYNNIGFCVKDCSETLNSKEKWYPCNSGGEYRKWATDDIMIVNWKDDGNEIRKFRNSSGKLAARPQNTKYYFKRGLTWNKNSTAHFAVKYKKEGYIFDDTSRAAFLKNETDLFYIIGILCSCVSFHYLEALNPTMSFTNGDIVRIPVCFCYDNRREHISKIVERNIILSQTDWNSFETSWDFMRHPLISSIRGVWDIEDMKNRENKKDLQQNLWISALFETWCDLCNRRFQQLKANEEELNRIFIDIYGLADELTPEVDDKDVTVRKADLGRDIRSFLSYAVGCMFGRYSIYKDGLCYAGGEWNREDFKYYANQYYDSGEYPKYLYRSSWFMPDEDNIIPITDEEYFPDDIVSRFVEFVKTVYGAETLEENLQFIADALGNKGGSTREVIRNYFLKDFYADHLKIYQKRPIYWLFDSGKENGFKALIYMHRYGADTVGRVRTDYLHRAQNYVEAAMQSAQYTIDNLSSASEKSKATKAVSKYTKQLAEMRIYDEAIAHIANRRIEIDLDDGVKVNYAKFQGIEVAQEGKKTLKVDLLAKI